MAQQQTQPIITLTTDFGSNDHLVAAMKGVMLSINPEVRIIDVSHHVMPFDILDAALILGQCYKTYPIRTIHVVVVDPGTGTQRRPIMVTGDKHFFIGPDNGVFSMVYEKEESFSVREITASHYFQTPVSNTFHGRDVFAPCAAWLAKNNAAASFGDQITDFVRFSMPKPKTVNGVLKGTVLKVDNFGNLLTNLTTEDVPQLVAGTPFKLNVGGKDIAKVAQTYMQGAPNEPFVISAVSGGGLDTLLGEIYEQLQEYRKQAGQKGKSVRMPDDEGIRA